MVLREILLAVVLSIAVFNVGLYGTAAIHAVVKYLIEAFRQLLQVLRGK